ncbi:MAG: hypothetical protein U0R26_09505 [Solirubrobacterales bacterium]
MAAVASALLALLLTATAPASPTSRQPGTPVPAKLEFTGLKPDLHDGTAILLAKVSGPGTLTLTGNKIIRRQAGSHGVGVVKLKVEAKDGARRRLNAKGRVRVGLTVAFAPEGGSPVTVSKKITLKKRLPRRGSL